MKLNFQARIGQQANLPENTTKILKIWAKELLQEFIKLVITHS